MEQTISGAILPFLANNRLDLLRAEVERHKPIAWEEIRKRWPGALAIQIFVYLAGYPVVAFVLAAVFCVIEITNIYLSRYTPPAEDMSRASLVATVLFAGAFAMSFHASALLIASEGSFAFYIFGLCGSMTALFVTAFNYTRLPTFFLVQTIPASLGIAAVALIGFGMDFETGETRSWLYVMFGAAILASLPLQLRRDMEEASRAVETLRAEAMQRLQQLDYLNRHDHLTDLLNRSAFDAVLEDHLTKAGPDRRVGLAIIDLDGFKPINDTYGHDAGDAVLVGVARKLSALEGCTAARLGGDEFALLMTAPIDPDFVATSQAVMDSIAEPIRFDDTDLEVSASIGIASTTDPSISPTKLFANADQAMFRAKSGRSKTPVLFEQARFAPRLTLMDKKRYQTAMRQREFRPHYQPKVSLADESTVGYEALARWERPGEDVAMPSTFLGDLEELGLMRDFTFSILRQVMEDISGWLEQGLDPGRIAVNVDEKMLATKSGRQDIEWLLAEYPEAQHHVTFEITEKVFIARSGDVIAASIAHFRTLGIQISLDDFGTGYASFQHLRELEFDELKIDCGFVSALGSDPVANVILDGFISIAHGLGVDVVAEGVETEEQQAFLRNRGCSCAQGFLFAPGMSHAAVTALMRGQQTAQAAAG